MTNLSKKIQGKKTQLPVMRTQEIKLKDKGRRNRIVLELKKQFGFMPDTIIIDKVHGRNNTIVISAVIPEVTIDEKSGKKGKSLDKSKGKNNKKGSKVGKDRNK